MFTGIHPLLWHTWPNGVAQSGWVSLFVGILERILQLYRIDRFPKTNKHRMR